MEARAQGDPEKRWRPVSKSVYNLACGCGSLRHPAKALVKERAWFADAAGQSIWPSVHTLAERTGLSRRAIQKHLRKLEEVSAIRALGSRLGGQHKTTRYSIDLGRSEEHTSE